MTAELHDPGLLRKIPLFDSLSDEQLRQILQAPENGIEEHGMRETIVKESETGECMYIILEGEVEVSIRGFGGSGRELPITRLRAGDFFGEQALIANDKTGRRNATVKTVFGAKLFRIDKKYVQLGLKKDTSGTEDITVPNASSQSIKIRETVEKMRLFQSLRESELQSIGTWTDVETIGPGDFILKESEKADCLYVVLKGRVEVFTLDEDGKVIILAAYGPGDYFGEQALLPGSSGERTAYARSHEEAQLLKIPKAYFKLILKRDSELAEALQKVGQAQQKQRETIQKH